MEADRIQTPHLYPQKEDQKAIWSCGQERLSKVKFGTATGFLKRVHYKAVILNWIYLFTARNISREMRAMNKNISVGAKTNLRRREKLKFFGFPPKAMPSPHLSGSQYGQEQLKCPELSEKTFLHHHPNRNVLISEIHRPNSFDVSRFTNTWDNVSPQWQSTGQHRKVNKNYFQTRASLKVVYCKHSCDEDIWN